MSEDESRYDVVVWGATGFTGQYVAEYLAENYDRSELDWAIAGRNSKKLRELRDDLAELDPELETLDILIGDALDRDSLDEIVEQTSVVCAAVGPFAKYGTNVVEACVENGTDYCDIAGEVHWLQQMVDEYHEDARERGVRIVHACGFDSIPSDLGTLMVQNYAKENYGTYCSEVRSFADIGEANISGGTIASLSGIFGTAPEVASSPYCLAPPGERDVPEDTFQRGPKHDDLVDEWTGAFILAILDEKVVRRTNALLDYPWGRDFRYSEAAPTGSGVTGALSATVASFMLTSMIASLKVNAINNFLNRFVFPKPGEGPTQEEIESNPCELRLVGTGQEPESGEGFAVEGVVAGPYDAGYGVTPWMLTEAGICLARGLVESPLEGGVLTPATGIGTPLIDRLRDAGMTFTVEEYTPPEN